MKALDHFSRFFLRFRYPVTLPEDIAIALGVDVSNYQTFTELVRCLESPDCCPTRLEKYMPRHEAENAFAGAQRKDCFKRSSLFSYYFSEGWMEFSLEFDPESRLRRVYIYHKEIQNERGIEIHLRKQNNNPRKRS
ncbi:MAG: hypothetical protein K940chlam7_01108 [Chlamydiae bacterium]|nr:hypothetical protein [Chlamydiota bacterium]